MRDKKWVWINRAGGGCKMKGEKWVWIDRAGGR